MSEFQDEYERIFNNGVIPPDMSICWLMSQLNISDIVRKIEQTYYSPHLRDYFHYPIDFLIKLTVVMTYRRIAYRHIRRKITEEDLSHLLPAKSPLWLPSPSTLHYFVKYRLGEEGMEVLMFLISKKIVHFLKSETEVIIDSTPLVASRYCPNSLFNPHYQVKMDKAHILNLGAYPLFMIHSEGTENDKPYAHFLIQIAELLGVSCDRVLMDAGYDSLELHTLIFEKLHAKPIIQLRSDAQLSPLGSEKTITKQINTFWRKGGNAQMSLTEKLVFLCKNGKREMVGAYLRNQTILHGREVKDAMKRRGTCERKHAHLKKTVKFDVVHCKKNNRALSAIMNFITFQLLMLAHLQNGFQNMNFANYR